MSSHIPSIPQEHCDCTTLPGRSRVFTGFLDPFSTPQTTAMKKNKTGGQSGITRREFMGAAAAATAFTIAPRYVLGGSGSPAPSDTLNIGLIGAGIMKADSLIEEQDIIGLLKEGLLLSRSR